MTTKLNDRASLRETLKTTAVTVRDLRTQARATSHDERASLKSEAKSYAHSTRYELLAYGYLRGLSIREMESPFTINHAHAQGIIDQAEGCFRKRADQPDEDYAAAWAEFKTTIQSDLKAWNNECKLRVMKRTAERAKAQREVA